MGHETRGRGGRPIGWLLIGMAVIILVFATGMTTAVLNMRDAALRNTEAALSSLSLALAEQANRSLLGVDLVLAEVVRRSRGGTREPWLKVRLAEHLTGLPFLRAITLFDAAGRIIDTSEAGTAEAAASADPDATRALRDDPTLPRVISAPRRLPGAEGWVADLIRPVRGPDGSLAGFVAGTLALRWFQDLYGATAVGDSQTISMLRLDDVLMVRIPATDRIGMRVVFGARPDGAARNIAAAHSAVDGQLRIKAAAALADFPLVVRVTETRATVLAAWTRLAWMISVAGAICLAGVLIACLAVIRWWHHQERLEQERRERAEAERLRAVAQADLARERERNAEEASRAKSGFLAMMSHEIRTPMNGVLGLAGTLLDGDLTAQQRRVVEAIRDSGDSLLRILNDILDLSKLDAGRMTFEDMPFSPLTLTHGIVSILGPRARAKGLTIGVSCDPALPAAVLGDAGRIRQVLLNLVSNAVKFTEAGSVALECRRLAQNDGKVRLRWLVRDTGIGIPPERIGALFGEFVQADATITRRFGGSGMGLSISRRLIEQMGGLINVESTPGEGTTFYVELTLPLTQAPGVETRAGAAVPLAFESFLKTLGRPLRVLFAEDNPTNQFVALQMLRTFNVHVDVAGDGLEAVDAATTFLYDVICMDMRMPEMDGLEATRLIRRQGGRLAALPIIALTANAFPEDVKACLDAGMTLFVAKPVQKEVLLHAILTALGAVTHITAPADDPAPQPADPVPEPSPPAAPADTTAAAAFDAAVLDEMEEAIGTDGVSEMIALFIDETEQRLARLSDSQRDRGADLREVHTLKGAAATVAAAALAESAKAIEARLRDGGTLTDAETARLETGFTGWRAAIARRVATTPAA